MPVSFNIAIPGVFCTTLSGYRSFKVVRQNTSGEFLPINVKVHCKTGVGRIKLVDMQLVRMDPGFMVLIPGHAFLVLFLTDFGLAGRRGWGRIKIICSSMKMGS